MNTKTYSISVTEGEIRILLGIIAKRAETDSPHNVRYLKEFQTNIIAQIETQGFDPPQSFKKLYLLKEKNYE